MKIVFAIAEFLFLGLLMLLVPLLIYVDLFIIGHGIPEASFTEYTQEGLLLLSAVAFGISAWRHPQYRGFLVLVAGFFTCMSVREQDAVFDKLVFHGFWVWLALIPAAVAIGYAWKLRATVLPGAVHFVGTRSYMHIAFGLLVLLVFSRTFGSGNLLWVDLMGESYTPVVKAAIQEGLELFGYLFIWYGSVLFLLKKDPLAVPAEAGRREVLEREMTAGR
jgi:hypothetical protein